MRVVWWLVRRISTDSIYDFLPTGVHSSCLYPSLEEALPHVAEVHLDGKRVDMPSFRKDILPLLEIREAS